MTAIKYPRSSDAARINSGATAEFARDKSHSTELDVKTREIAVIGIRGLPADYGGFETCAEYTTACWADKGNQVLVYCRKNRYKERALKINGVRLKYTASIGSKHLDTLSHTFLSVINLLITERQIKCIHLYNAGNAIFLPILKLFGKKVALSGDGLEWKREKWGGLAKMVHKLGEKMAVSLADKIVADNVEVQKYYKDNHDIDAALIAYGAKNIEYDQDRSSSLMEKYGLRPKEYFVFIGRIVPEKGVHNLIDAYEKLDTDIPLVIIGDDVNKTPYRDKLFERQTDKVKFLGFIYDHDYEQLLMNSLLYVSASELEGTSPSLLGAMGAQVCALVNGIEENLATVNECAYTFKKNDYQDLRDTWQKLIDEPELIQKMAENGHQHVIANYCWGAIADQYLSVFDEIG